jgi:DNA-binding GntR family transcriptional regulator
MRESFSQAQLKPVPDTEKAPVVVIKKIRDAILEGTFKPGDRLLEIELGERFRVSRSPVREALLALEKEGTVIMTPYRGAMVKPLSPEEVLDIAELRLTLIQLAAKLAQRHLAPADFDSAYQLAQQITHTRSAKEYFEINGRFWSVILDKAQRPILRETFSQLEDRGTRYVPLLLDLYPSHETRPRPREVLIELYRRGEVGEALRSFKRIYLEVMRRVINRL